MEPANNLIPAPRSLATPVLALLVVVGVLGVGIWSNLLGYSASLVPVHNTAGVSAAYTAGRLTAALCMIVWARSMEDRVSPIAPIVGVALSAVAVIIVLSAHLYGDPLMGPEARLVSMIASFVGGFGFLVLSGLLFAALARAVSVRLAAVCVMVGIVGECFFASLGNVFLDGGLQLALCAILPLISGLSATVCAAASKEAALDDASAPLAERRSASWLRDPRDAAGTVLMLLQVSFAAALAAVLRSLSVMGPWGFAHNGYMGVQQPQFLTMIGACGIVAASILAVFVLPKRLPSQVKCAVLLVVVLVGLELTAAHLGSPVSPGDPLGAITMGCQLLGRALIWISFVVCVRQVSLPALRVCGIAFVFNVLASSSLAFGIDSGVDTSGLVIGLVFVLLAISLIAVALPFVGGSARAEALNRHEADLGRGDRACEFAEISKNIEGARTQAGGRDLHAFAEAHGISTREEHVLALLIEGHTRGQIERLLGLAEGTVRTHVNAVYRKTAVHSKTELIESYYDFLGDEPLD